MNLCNFRTISIIWPMRKEFVPKCRRLKSKANEKLIVNNSSLRKSMYLLQYKRPGWFNELGSWIT
jgi:hypothetical protein